MVGMPATVSFVFNGEGRLSETVVLFPNADFGLISSLMTGIQGQAADDNSGDPPTRTWRDQRRGSIITAVPVAGSGTRLSYRPG
jgi:hypothetical protein